MSGVLPGWWQNTKLCGNLGVLIHFTLKSAQQFIFIGVMVCSFAAYPQYPLIIKHGKDPILFFEVPILLDPVSAVMFKNFYPY